MLTSSARAVAKDRFIKGGVALGMLIGVAITPIALVLDGAPAGAAITTSYAPATPSLDTITSPSTCTSTSTVTCAPWNEWQGDSGSPSYTSQSPGAVWPTYEDGGATTTTANGAGGANVTAPNLSIVPGAASGTDGVAPYPSGVVGTPGPLDGYCGSGTNPTESAGSPVRQPAGTTLPLAPAYFPHIVANADGSLTGYFDYRPKDADEALVAASSTDGGHSWTYEGEALEQDNGYCPTGDTNDDGEGHANIIPTGGTSRLYTLERAAGDNVGVGMLVHSLSGATESAPLNAVPAAEQAGIDPDDFASTAVTVNHTGGTAVTINFSQPVGSGPEGLVAGQFVDVTRTPTPNASSVINCTGVGTSSLTTCTTTAAGGINVLPGDLIEQVIATMPAATIPAGPNKTTGDGGNSSITVTPTNANNLTMAIFNANAPGRLYVDGKAVYCAQSNALPTTKIENCTTGPGGSALTVAAGDPVTADPIVPATATQTTGLISPDGIVGVLPSYPGAASGDTVVMYTEKVLNYFIVGYTGGATTFSNNMSIAFTQFPNTSSVPLNAGANTVYLGDSTTNNTIVTETCTGYNSGTHTLSGCSGGPVGDSIAKNTYIGGPGAAITPEPTLAKTGEGSTKGSAGQKLLGNNEDLTELRVAETSDGVNFTDLGAISGSSNNTSGTGSYNDISNPVIQNSPSNLNAYSTAGTKLADEMRYVGSAGSIITNPDGSYGLFLSGAWAADGDSDAFNQIFYSQSSDGQSWSEPVSVISTDYTFAASIAQDTAGSNTPIGISAYYEGRAYGPSVVQNPNGSLTLVFAGYRFPKSIVTAGSKLGTGSAQWTVGANDPTMYRNILTTTLQSSTSPAVPTQTNASSSPASPVVGQAVTLSATVTVPSPGTGTATGTVTFSDAGGTLCSAPLSDASPDSASCNTTYTGTQTDAVTASYNGDSNYAISQGTTDVTVGPDATSTTVTSTPNPSVVGQPVTFTGAVAVTAPGVGAPTGTVTFSGNAGALCTANLNASAPGQASCITTYAAATAESVTATYSGDTNDQTSTSAPLPQTVNPDATTTTVSFTPAAPVSGQSVSFTATVGADAPGAGTPTGTVTISDSGGTLCTATLSGASPDTATCSATYPGSTADAVTATYGGDGNFTTSSGTTTVTVGKASTMTGLAISPSSVLVGQTITLSATVRAELPGAGTPTGSVVFSDAGGTRCTATLNGASPDVASCTTSYPGPTSATITASYGGDANFSGSSATGMLTVAKASSTTTITSSANPAVNGQPLQFTATVAPVAPAAGVPTGSVTFTLSDTAPPAVTCQGGNTVALSGGTAVCTIPAGAVVAQSPITVTAAYGGSTAYGASTSSHFTQTVKKDGSTVTISAQQNPTVTNQGANFTAVVSATAPGTGVPTGVVAWKVISAHGVQVPCVLVNNILKNGVASCAVGPNEMTASNGPFTVTVSYPGDADFTASTGTFTQNIVRASTTVEVAIYVLPVPGFPGIIQAAAVPVAPGTGSPTGTATFHISGRAGAIHCSGSDTIALGGTVATCVTAAPLTIADAPYSVTVTYSGDDNFAPSSSNPAPFSF